MEISNIKNIPLTDVKDFSFGDKEPFRFEGDGCTYFIPDNPNKSIKVVYDPPKWTIREAKVQGQDYTIELVQLNTIERVLIIRKEYEDSFDFVGNKVNNSSVKLIIECYNNWHELETIECKFGEEYNNEIKFQDLVLKPIYDIQGLNHVKKNKYPLYNHAQYETEDGTHEIANDVIGYMYTWEFTT